MGVTVHPHFTVTAKHTEESLSGYIHSTETFGSPAPSLPGVRNPEWEQEGEGVWVGVGE